MRTIADELPQIGARISGLEHSDQVAVLSYVEYLEWRRNDRPLLKNDSRKGLAAAMAPRFQAIREALGKTWQQAADNAGVSLSTYTKFETRGPYRWPTSSVEEYCERWNVNAEWLTTGNGPMFRGSRQRDNLLTFPVSKRAPTGVEGGTS